jgi:3-oxoacyl-[acyl-carrier-protein] synthase-3
MITGLGAAVPPGLLTNADIEARDIGTTDDWIVDRTGIKQRHYGGTTAGLAVEAGRIALEQAGLTGADIDLVILATCSPDDLVAPNAGLVQQQLGIRGGAFDLNAACTGFVYSLIVASGLITTGLNRVLVIGSETLSRVTDPLDRNTVILFGDGAGAVVVEACDGPGNILGWHVDADGEAYYDLYAPFDVESAQMPHIKMQGKAVFRKAIETMTASGIEALSAAGVTADQLDLYVPHQANTRIIDVAIKKMGLAQDKVVLTLHKFGNTSGASIPLALDDAQKAGRLHDGDLVLLSGFGAGMTSASAVVRWGRTTS